MNEPQNVTINPDDRAQVAALLSAYTEAFGGVTFATVAVDKMQDALRAIAPPATPAEPRAPHAVIADASGHTWTRIGPDDTPWVRYNPDAKALEQKAWPELQPDKVLREQA